MEIPKRTKETDIGQSVVRGKAFKRFVDKTARELARRYTEGKDGLLLHELIAETAKAESLSRVKIQALVEETNTQTYLALYAKKRHQNERDVRFPLASLAKVVEALGADAPPEVDNPNVVTGESGEGEMVKKASAATRHGLYHDDERVRARHEARLAREAEAGRAKEARALEATVKDGLFKVAHALVRTEQVHGGANEVFNTLLDTVALDDASVDTLIKQASDISGRLRQGGKILEKHMVNLKVDGNEKVAAHLLGAYSLNRADGERGRIRDLPVSGHMGIDGFDDLVKVARDVAAAGTRLREIKKD